VLPLGHGILRTRVYPEFELLATVQGVAIRPLVEGLKVEAGKTGIAIAGAGAEAPLHLSDTGDLSAVGAALGDLETTVPVFDFGEWERGGSRRQVADKHVLQRELALAHPVDRNEARLRLARFHFAHGLGSDVLGLLKLIEEDEPALLERQDVRAMRGASAFANQDFARAREDLFHRSLDGQAEIGLWRGALAAVAGDFEGAAREFARGGALITVYPRHYRMRLGALAAEAALETGDVHRGKQLIAMLEAAEPTREERQTIRYLEARHAEKVGDPVKALELYAKVAAGANAEAAAKASLAAIELELAQESIKPAAALDALDKLRFAWRGGNFEFDLLRLIGRIQIAEGDPREGLANLRRVATYFPDHPRADAVAEEMAAVFKALYLGGEGKALAPLAAVAIYEDFKELTPPGPEGDRMVQALAERLVAVDLLDRATELLAHQVGFRLKGEERARVAARLAMIHLLDRKPAKAIDVLRASGDGEMSEDLRRDRRTLMARALADMKRGEEALRLLGADRDADADRVRADIHWERRDWVRAAESLSRLAEDLPGPGGRLDDDGVGTVMRWAVALALEGKREGLARLRARFANAMNLTPHKDSFVVLTDPAGASAADYRELAEKVADVPTLRAFMTSYRARMKTAGLAALN